MKTISHLLVLVLFFLFFASTFIYQKTIIFYYQDSYYSYITYTRNINDLARSIHKPYIVWKLEENKAHDSIHEGMMIKLISPLPKQK